MLVFQLGSRHSIYPQTGKIPTLTWKKLEFAKTVPESQINVDELSNCMNLAQGTIGAENEEKKSTKASNNSAEEASSLRAAIEAGTIDVRGAWGQTFKRAQTKDEALAADYKALTSNAARAQFRLDWANRKLQGIKEAGWTHSKRYQEVDERHGKYLPFGMVVEQYGALYNLKAATEAAVKYCNKCVKMGGRWLFWDGMAEVMTYFHVSRQNKQAQQGKWSHERGIFSK